MSDRKSVQEREYLRPVTENDIWLLYEWANDPSVRRNSFNTNPITKEEHQSWFQKKLDSNLDHLYIYGIIDEKSRKKEIGQIRIAEENSEGRAEISYSIAAPYRGKGYGKRMVLLLEDTVRRNYPAILILTARVKENNEASQHVFIACGFKEHGGSAGENCLIFEKKL